MDVAWRLAEERGPLSLTMSEIAQAAAIGRATLYKYFADVESILVACHAQHVERHLDELQRLASGPGTSASRLVMPRLRRAGGTDALPRPRRVGTPASRSATSR